jgi:hypothetical protein
MAAERNARPAQTRRAFFAGCAVPKEFRMRNVFAVFAMALLLAASASAATFTVTNTSDSGAGSLRQAIDDANGSTRSTGVPATVAFSIGSGVRMLAPLTSLNIFANVTIDGTTQPGYAGTPLIELNLSLIPTGGNVSCIDSAGTIRGLALNRCGSRAIAMNGGRVTACFIGTDVTGHNALPNSVGILVSGQPGLVGGSTDAEGNLISGNQQNLIAGPGSEIAHNRIGTDVTGEATFAFKEASAILVENGQDISIHDNVIAGHSIGIDCFVAPGVRINANRIGISASNKPLPNRVGVHLYRTDLALIGTSGANIIAYNTLAAIEIDGNSIRNAIRGNSIHHNGSMGIDLSVSAYVDGVTPNDSGDGDGGPNLLQNFPVLTNVTSAGGQTTITGTINTSANQLITLDFYASGQCSISGNGEGETPLGTSSVQTDGSGNGTFTATFAASLAPGTVVTATATDPFGNTSEFSACRALQAAGTFIVSPSAVVAEGAGSVTVIVERTNGTGGVAAVNYATVNGTATAGSDYTSRSGTLSFDDGEVSKSVVVPITNDGTYEGNEGFTFTLSGATNGTLIGSPSTETITIVDDEKPPSISVPDAALLEGSSGASNMTFTVTLTGATALPVTVKYGTSASTATAGVDFQTVGGTLTFNPGETQKTISVPIFGDTVVEESEFFSVSLFSVVNATIARGTATGTIINDDGGLGSRTVTASDVTIVEGNNGITNAVITLVASQPFSGEVDFFTMEGTAKSRSDFTPRTSVVSFFGETTKTFVVPIVVDTFAEPDETFTVQLSLIESFNFGFTLARSAVNVTIVNDDAGAGPSNLIIPAGSSLPIIVSLGGSGAQPVSFSSSNSSVATVPSLVQVSGSALVDVTGLRAGNATITANLPAPFGNVPIEITVYDAANLELSPPAVRIPVGGTATIGASFNPPLNVAEEAVMTTAGFGTITYPDRVSVAPSQNAAFTIKGVTKGHLLLSATLGALRGNAVTSISVDVVDPAKAPAITQVAPTNGPAAGGTSVTVTGVNLRTDCTIRFGGVPATNITALSSISMTVITPAHASGAVDVSLACGADAFTFTNGFTYVAVIPTLSSVTPSLGSTAGSTLVTIAGTNFASDCWPFFDGIAARAAIVNGPAEMIAAAPAHAVAATVPVLLRCTGAEVLLSNAFTYTSTEEPAPVISGVDPLVGSPGKSVTISGARFRLDDAVTFDLAAAKILSTSPGTHVVRIPDLPLGKTSITVTDARGHVSTTGPIFAIVEPQPPQITSVTPAAARPANEIILDGSGFRPGYTFSIGDQPAPIVTMTYTRVVLRVPQINAGTYGINVLNAASAVSAVGPQLTVLAAGLAVTRVSPACVTTTGRGPMTITGSGFATGVVVTFDGAMAAGAVVVDAQTITLTAPFLPVGTPRIAVTNPNGDSASLTNAFTVTSPFDPNGCTPRARPARH